MSIDQNKTYRLNPRTQILIRQLIHRHSWITEFKNDENNYEVWLNYLSEVAKKMSGIQTTPAGSWRQMAAERILNYLTYKDLLIKDSFRGKEKLPNDSFKPLWNALTKGVSEAGEHYFKDMLALFDQLSGHLKPPSVSFDDLHTWMNRYPTGLDEKMIKDRRKNKERIIQYIIGQIDRGEIKHERYSFPADASMEKKLELVNEWWNTKSFHLRFAVRDPETLNKILNNSLPNSTMRTLRKANEEGMPFFINTYYLSLLNVSEDCEHIGSDLAIREYILYNRDIIEEYGKIEAWEKEDKVVPGEPNAAGWLLPYQNNLHRRYPEVAIMIPDTMGRTCGGLCVSCQRMYEFQSGNLNFNLDRSIEHEKWNKKLEVIMDYFQNDKQLRDILITGDDALMSRDKSLKRMFDAILVMAAKKKRDNQSRPNGEKYAEILRIRLGTRLPAYLPQRVTDALTEMLRSFRNEAMKIGIRQFVIQTHFESPMEVTPESTAAIQKLINAGWLVTNQHVFTVASSRRGHMAKLRATLAKVGVIPYYTFSVKGFQENRHNFATHARMMQEKHEEKVFGIPENIISQDIHDQVLGGRLSAVEMVVIMKTQKIPFIASDRSMMNLPGIGKSMTFQTIGITPDGRRILQFDYDHSRKHSPAVNKDKKVIIIESKSVSAYLNQIENSGEDPEEYSSIFGYSRGESETLFPLFAYPGYPIQVTSELNNYGEYEAT